MEMPRKTTYGILFVMITSQWLFLLGTCFVGVNYGTQGDNLPAPADAVNLMKSNQITAVRLYEPDLPILDALRGSGISVSLGVKNEDLQNLASSTEATDGWLNTNVIPYQDVSFIYITLGNEVVPGPFSQFVLLAMQNMKTSLDNAGLSAQIAVTTDVSMAVLGASYPPSQGTFADDVVDIMTDITKFLYGNCAPLLVNAYPYMALISDPGHISMPFALFTSPDPVIVDGDWTYYNLYDAMIDSFVAATAKVVGADDMPIVVSETGWPSAGNDPYTTVDNARTYNNNLKNQVLSKGTPRRPNVLLNAFIFSLFNEDLKPVGVEQNWGNFYPSMQPVYPLWGSQ
ncbi:hypothetical protein Sjap_007925 [Stephania japonica]|uniref:Glucan endo-1,3-beta-D-glucosidase n=1 Tax=Stephania japonica TaxID=461633 RepID=A0AAP0JNI6_9MAGN